MVFCMLSMCSRRRRMMNSRIPKRTSGHLDRVTCRCPEVGLGFVNLTSGHLGSFQGPMNLLVSRGRFRTSQFDLWTPGTLPWDHDFVGVQRLEKDSCVYDLCMGGCLRGRV